MSNSRSSNSKSKRERVSRRMVLKGAGVAMALPWLESLPVFLQAAVVTTTGAPLLGAGSELLLLDSSF